MTVSNAKALKILLGALIKNKFRFGEATSKKKKIGLFVLLGIAYLSILLVVLSITIALGFVLVEYGMGQIAYFIILLVGAAVVLIFGIINLVTTLYLAKDTDFYSMLPVNPTVVFLAKLLYVYFSEAVIVGAVVLPAMIAFGIVAKMWAGYYIISLLMLPIIPALPLIVAAIFAIPVMYIAGKTKNRNIVPFIFYCVMFFGFFALYFYMVFSSNSSDGMSQEQIESMIAVMQVFGYILYPYTAITSAALKIPSFGLSAGLSVLVNLLIFIGVSAVLLGLITLLGHVMYSQSAKSNNQTDNSKVKVGSFKSTGGLRALIKREYIIAMRTPAVAFQCFGAVFIPVIFSIMLGAGLINVFIPPEDAGVTLDKMFGTVIALSVLIIMLPTVANGAITSFSREGTTLATLKVMPLPVSRIVLAKAIAWSIFACPAGIVSAVIIGAFNFDALYFVLSLVAFTILPAIYVIYGVLWDLAAPKLKWNDPIQAVKHNTHATVGQLLGMLAGVVLTVFSAVLPLALNFGYAGTALTFWLLVLVVMIIFGVSSAVLYKRAEKHYNSIEL